MRTRHKPFAIRTARPRRPENRGVGNEFGGWGKQGERGGGGGGRGEWKMNLELELELDQ